MENQILEEILFHLKEQRKAVNSIKLNTGIVAIGLIVGVILGLAVAFA